MDSLRFKTIAMDVFNNFGSNTLRRRSLHVVMLMVVCTAFVVACIKREEDPHVSSVEHGSSPQPLEEAAPSSARSPAPKVGSEAEYPAVPLEPVVPNPSPSPVKPSNPHSSIDRILAAMNTASIAFNSPTIINLEETAQIQLLLSLQETIDELKSELSLAGEREGARVKVSKDMEARLSGPNFQITAITPDVQAIGSIETVEWRWEVKPVDEGRHNLHLTLTALINVDGSDSRRAIRTFDKAIQVMVTPEQRVSAFIRKNWQWLWGSYFGSNCNGAVEAL
jgi:hypothetical protein